MREYELMFIVHPDLDENAFNDVVSKVTGWIKEDGGEITKTEVWGKRPLAYPLRKRREGQYVLMHAKMSPKHGAVLDRNLRFLEPVMRFMLTTK